MEKIQSLPFYKNPKLILALILSAFFLKGVFLATITPIFVGQDEARHYSSIQYLAEPRPVTWPLIERKATEEDGIQRYNYSQEVLGTAKAMDFDRANDDIYTTFDFTHGYYGKNEAQVNNNDWHQYNEYSPPNIAGASLYHRLASGIEKIFQNQSILVRYYLIRIFSVLLGTLTILFSYLIAKNIGFSPKSSLLMTAIIAFQPRFSIYYATINYDALLILAFVLFTLSGVLALKNGPNWKNTLLIITSVYIGMLTKQTSYVLLIGACLLLAYFLYKKVKFRSRSIKFAAYLLIVLAAVIVSLYFKQHFIKNTGSFGDVTTSIRSYLDESVTPGRFALSSRTYWGTLSWVNNWFLDNMTNFIWYTQGIATIGVALFLIFKKKLSYMPEKKYVVFLIFMLVLLQLGIRVADWIVFKRTGSLDLGTPGRYFLPNLTTHIILVFTGIGMLLRKEKIFEAFLIIGLILMMAFMMFIIFDVTIIRFYV